MAGHSKFANIKHRKAAQDSKKAKFFTKLVREVIVAASQGLPDPAFNPRLRTALSAARKAGVTKDRLDAATKKGQGTEGSVQYDEIRYEGYGPAGSALIVSALTDNKNRTAAEVRSAFTKHGGALGETGSVGFMFDRVGMLKYEEKIASHEDMFNAAIEAGAEDCSFVDQEHIIICAPEEFSNVRDYLVQHFGEPEIARLDWKAKELIDPTEDQLISIMKLIDVLEDNDDVQFVTGNYKLPPMDDE